MDFKFGGDSDAGTAWLHKPFVRRKLTLTDVISKGSLSYTGKTPVDSVCTGRVNLSPNGFGFVTNEKQGSFFIHGKKALALLNKDEIRFVKGADMEKPFVQRVLSISRAAGILMCEVKGSLDGLDLRAEDPCFVPLLLPSYDGVCPGDVVAVRYPAYEGEPFAKPIAVSLISNLGQRQPGLEFASRYAQAKYGFDLRADESLVTEAVRIAAQPCASRGVLDIPFVTIDGASTEDFDDAVHAEILPEGGWQVSVAIADVSSIVQPGSALDKAAFAQSTSVYLPGVHIPMLPKGLSLDMCSLKEGVVRSAVVLTMHLSTAGKVLSRCIQRAQIRSAARLTYTQVARYMSGKLTERFAGAVESSLTEMIKVYEILNLARRGRGVLEIEEPDPHLVEGVEGKISLVWEHRTLAHKLIEELMCLANAQAAEILMERYGSGLFRHQPAPNTSAWTELQAWALKRGFELAAQPSQAAIIEFIEHQATNSAEAAANAVYRIRSAMNPATYVVREASEPCGHFSLNLPLYTHFTSPIRRYADLVVHRLLVAPDGSKMSRGDFQALSRSMDHTCEQAVKARAAERYVWDRIKQNCLLDAVDNTTRLKSRVLRCNAKGARVLLSDWQVPAWLMAPELREQGFTFYSGVWQRADGEGRTPAMIQETDTVFVHWHALDHQNPSAPELLVKLID